jgi:hypothetical protein
VEAEQTFTREEVKQQMLDYLQLKYDQEFASYTVAYRGFDRDDELMTAYPATEDVKFDDTGKPIYSFSVWRSGDMFDPDFSDGYVGYVMWPQVREQVTEVVHGHFPDAVVALNPISHDPYPAELRPDISYADFVDYLKAEGFITVEVAIAAPEDSTAESVAEPYAALQAELAERFGTGWLYLEAFTPEKFNDYLLLHKSVAAGLTLPKSHQSFFQAGRFEK